ncbi:hypothetical protein [Aurantibacillus circumpalustris]|uniref:hypothetical protein n=1 Tax=Aurantibacillus circumpalustris TaxID=3036359 RepID=UPI00295BDA30|nr:hypothetical protein [Aurantibacillus circumpalustris]
MYKTEYLKKLAQNRADKETARETAFETKLGENLATKQDIAEITSKIEEVKQKFDLNKITYQIQYAKLHERRMSIIEQMYEMVIILNNHLMDYVSPFQSSKSGKQEDFEKEQLDKQTNTFNAYNTLLQFYHTKKLFFDDNVRQKAEELLNLIRSKLLDFTSVERMKSYGVIQAELKEHYEKRHQAGNFISEEFPKLLNSLEKEFQKTIGVE